MALIPSRCHFVEPGALRPEVLVSLGLVTLAPRAQSRAVFLRLPPLVVLVVPLVVLPEDRRAGHLRWLAGEFLLPAQRSQHWRPGRW